MIRKVDLAPDEYYHIYNRGVEKRKLFLDEKDYARFVKLLYLCNGSRAFVVRDLPKGSAFDWDRGYSLVDIGAYCVMPNHFHLFLYEKKEGGITKFLHKLLTAYSMYFNKKYKRKGVLFESVFQSVHAESDEYMQYILAYIHLNPVKLLQPDWKEKGIVDLKEAKRYLDGYYHSSYFDYVIAYRKESRILNTENFPEYFSGRKEFRDFMDSWLCYGDNFTLEAELPKSPELSEQAGNDNEDLST